MKNPQHSASALSGIWLVSLTALAPAQQDPDVEVMSAARQRRMEVLSQRHDMNDGRERAEVVRQLQDAHDRQDAALRRRAKALGLSLEGDRPGGGRFRLADIDENNQPVYEQTENTSAGVSTATNLVRSTAPYNVTGSGVKIGLWEAGGIPRLTHQEITGRAIVYDGATTVSSHATHVAGTLASAGIVANTLGMAPAGFLECRNSTNSITEMTARGAASPSSTGLFLSNHSYGGAVGWEGSVWHGSFVNDAITTNDNEADFGRYSSGAVDWDGMVANLPYYLIFTSAGNHRNDAPPATGGTWTSAGVSYTYNSAIHPKGDGVYKSGYDTMEGGKLAKNVIAVGATYDGVSSGIRYPASASITTFSCWGPADDGRIKPDIVAVGYGVLSCESTSNTATTYKDGTSMASPNACGSAALLVQYYSSRFPGGAMRASTLKGLILHTADDLGTPGPDYKTGWGLMNTKAAAEVIRQHADGDGGAFMIESSIATGTNPKTHSISWDGATPLRVTLCWTDPAGTARTTHDNRNKALVNDLDLAVFTPGGGTIHYPYVMPHVGDWTEATLGAAAVTGVNTVDNVEQVNLPPTAGGNYIVTVGYTGTLTGGSQNYSLIVSGRKAAKVAVEENGPPVVVLAPDTAVTDFGAAAPSQATLKRTFTIRNDGEYTLTGLAITKSGPHAADYTLSNFLTTQFVTGQRATLTVSYDPTGPGSRNAMLRVASSDSSGPFDIHLTGTGLTEQEAWRSVHFNTTANSGNAADDFDADGDNVVNLMEYALATSPTAANPLPVKSGINGGSFEYIYQRNKLALPEVTYSIMWTDDMGSGDWRSDGVTEAMVSDVGGVQSVRATIPLGGGNQRFIRLQVSKE